MAITYTHVISFLTSVAVVVPDQLDCDGCFEMISEFADAERRGDELSDALKAVQNHLHQCPCCAYEYETLVEAIHEADSN